MESRKGTIIKIVEFRKGMIIKIVKLILISNSLTSIEPLFLLFSFCFLLFFFLVMSRLPHLFLTVAEFSPKMSEPHL